jgi:hypothetical protein
MIAGTGQKASPRLTNAQERFIDIATDLCYPHLVNLGSKGTNVKKPELIQLIAIWRFIAAALLAIGIIVIAAIPIPEAVGQANNSSLIALSIGIVVLIALIGLSLAAGIGLMKGKSWGWTLGIVNAVLDLFSIPIGTVIGILILIYLFKQEVRVYFATSQE